MSILKKLLCIIIKNIRENINKSQQGNNPELCRYTICR